MKREIWNIFLNVELVLATFLGVIIVIPIFLGVNSYVVLSGSMEPVIHTGSLCYVNTKIDPDRIEVDDIIAFTVGNINVTHRVNAINEDGTITTKGDANKTSDGNALSKNDVMGKVITSVPKLGYLITFMKSKFGILMMVILIVINIFAGRKLKYKEKRENEKI